MRSEASRRSERKVQPLVPVAAIAALYSDNPFNNKSYCARIEAELNLTVAG